jgi:hypothetical protein
MNHLFKKKNSKQTNLPLISKFEGIGSIFRVPRYDSKGNHLVAAIREEWIKEIIKKREKFCVLCIYGEISACDSVTQILNNPDFDEYCESIEIVFGPKLYSENKKDELKVLLKNHKKLKLYLCADRCSDHGLLIKNNIMYEENHPIGSGYSTALIIEHCDQNAQSLFYSRFNSLKANATQIDASNIEQVETCIPIKKDS